MKYPKVRFIFDRRKKAFDTHPGTVDLEISFNNKRKWLSTGVAVCRDQWSDQTHVIRHPDCAELNLRLDAFRKPIDRYINLLMINGEPFSFEGLSTAMNNARHDGNFIEFASSCIVERRDIRESTRKQHRKLIRALKDFKRITTFASLTRDNIMAYDRWLHDQGYRQPTVHSYHKFLKIYIYEAMSRGLVEKNPYLNVKIEIGHSAERKYLTGEEIRMIAEKKMPTRNLEKVRDCFMFQYYTGMAYAEMEHFDPGRIVVRDKRHVYHARRQKTSSDFYIVIIPKAMDILRRYGNRLPLMTNQQYNMRLKIMAEAAGVTKPLTSHMARHSFAVHALASKVPIETVSRMLGHTDIKTTQIYAKVVNSSIDEAFDLLKDRL